VCLCSLDFEVWERDKAAGNRKDGGQTEILRESVKADWLVMAHAHTVQCWGVVKVDIERVHDLVVVSDLACCVHDLDVENDGHGCRRSVGVGTMDGNHDFHPTGIFHSLERLSCPRRRSWRENVKCVHCYSLN